MTTLVLTEKLGVLPDRVFESMFNDRLVAKGTVLQVVTDVFRQYLSVTGGGADELVQLLHKAKIAHRLLDFFPPGQQTEDAFKAHFEKEGLQFLVRCRLLELSESPRRYVRAQKRTSSVFHHAVLRVQVEWQAKKLQENSIVQLEEALLASISEEEGVDAYLETVGEHAGSCPPEEVIKVIWKAIIGSLNMVGKNQLQLMQMILKTVKANKKLLEAYTTTAKLELALLNCVQVTCYEDSKLLKVCVGVCEFDHCWRCWRCIVILVGGAQCVRRTPTCRCLWTWSSSCTTWTSWQRTRSCFGTKRALLLVAGTCFSMTFSPLSSGLKRRRRTIRAWL